ncbi:MAG TPA: hypothetical protein VL404_07140 [Candidatus Eisenbacteria bacterium]|nr:hypothetical protein [Candidatus Eisenbacteria bacterium]
MNGTVKRAVRLSLLSALFAAASVFPAAAEDPKEDYLVSVPGRIMEIGPTGAGYVVVRNDDGTRFLVFTDNQNKYLPGPPKPVEVGRTPAFAGSLRRVGELEAPDEQLPPALLEAAPELAEGEAVTDGYRDRAKKRAALERRFHKRWVVDIREERGQEVYDCQDLYDGDGILLMSVKKNISRDAVASKEAA